MRKKLLLPFMMLCILGSSFSLAQPSVTLNLVNAPQYNHCIVPQDIMFTYYGHVSGYLPTDTITLNANFGDGSDTIIYYPGSTATIYGHITHLYSFPGNYSTIFILTGPNGTADSVVSYNQILLSMTCGNISGTVYLDTNSNCIIDANELLLHWLPVKLYQNGTLIATTTTDTSGSYAFNVPTGYTYDVVVDLNNMTGLAFSCPINGTYPNVTVPSSNLNFGLICNHPGFDLDGYLYGSGFRPGFHANIWPYIFNHGCQSQTGMAKLVLDSLLHYVSSTPSPAAIIGDTLIWNFGPLTNLNYFTPHLVVLTDAAALVGDSVDLKLILLPIAGDNNPANNIIIRRFPIRNSWDPNEKSVSPAGDGAQGIILQQTPLQYTIHFQNTGNDVAYNVFIYDTLDADLDLNTFHLDASSHPVETFILQGNILKFNFNNILLPTASMNPDASQGYITYTIIPKAALPDGSPIVNSANIYFDFNPGMATNAVLNTIIYTTVGENELTQLSSVIVFPNPMHTQAVFNIRNYTATGPVKLSVYDLNGKLVKEVMESNGEQLLLNREDMRNGIYYFRLNDSEETVIGTGKLVVL